MNKYEVRTDSYSKIIRNAEILVCITVFSTGWCIVLRKFYPSQNRDAVPKEKVEIYVALQRYALSKVKYHLGRT